MRKTVMPFVLSMGLIAVWAAPADAAATRVEYIAQVDPICLASAQPASEALQAYHRNLKRLARLAKSGTLKAWKKQVARTARSLVRMNEIDTRLTDQIAAVAPPPNDAGTIATWIDYRSEAITHGRGAVTALRFFNFTAFRWHVRQGDIDWAAGVQTISGFGFQVCGVSV
jgi:hypothetical protein